MSDDTNTISSTAAAATTTASRRRALSTRWRWLAGVGGAFGVIALTYGLYWAQVLRFHQSTDDAYVGGIVVQITPQISGTVAGPSALRDDRLSNRALRR